jgi:dienelactone hydrolase
VKEFKGSLLELYTASLRQVDPRSSAFIRVELSRAQIMLVCGKADTLWPSCEMADQVQARAVRLGGPRVEVLAYANAGHGVFGVPVERSNPNYDRLDFFGGTDDGNNAARADSWPKVIALLQNAMQAPPTTP